MPREVGPPKKHRRFPGMTREDVEALDALAAEQGPEAAREFERFMNRERYEQRQWRGTVVPESEFGQGGVEFVSYLTRYGDGSGGGSRRRPRGHGADD